MISRQYATMKILETEPNGADIGGKAGVVVSEDAVHRLVLSITGGQMLAPTSLRMQRSLQNKWQKKAKKEMEVKPWKRVEKVEVKPWKEVEKEVEEETEKEVEEETWEETEKEAEEAEEETWKETEEEVEEDPWEEMVCST